MYALCAEAGGALGLAEGVATRGALLFRLSVGTVAGLIAVSLGDGRLIEPRGRRNAVTVWGSVAVTRVAGRAPMFVASRSPVARTYTHAALLPEIGYLRRARLLRPPTGTP